ncbi:MAG: membrane protein insertase YidC, partial [Spirochaetes bacterium]|nr:membrane protein insertase YidC [Spirochaetota bacterium]
MEKNTILAVLLSTVVIIGFYVLQGIFFKPAVPVTPSVEQPPAVTAVETPGQAEQRSSQTASQTAPQLAQDSVSGQTYASMDAGPQAVENITIDTELLTAVFTNSGGDIVSWKLKDHKEHLGKDDNVDMIFSGS